MKLLGAIIAGGRSHRFDGDKAAALLGARALLDHVRMALTPQVEDLIICGREWPDMVTVADRPGPDLGPLGGLCGALHYAAAYGYDAVLSAGCDVLPVPDLRALIGPVAAVVEGQRLLGFWPVEFAPLLESHLAGQTDRSIRQWVIASGARSIGCPIDFHNLNTREDLALYAATIGSGAERP